MKKYTLMNTLIVATGISIMFWVAKESSDAESRLVEMAGIEPASENFQSKSLHA